jgi:hypothetical protein
MARSNRDYLSVLCYCIYHLKYLTGDQVADDDVQKGKRERGREEMIGGMEN